MAYTNAWTTVAPDNLTLANQIDDEFRKLRLDIQERENTIIGAPGNWGTDPVIDGTNVKSLAQLSAGLVGKPNINASNNTLPKRLDANNLTDSGLSDDGTTVTFALARKVRINGLEYTWPTVAPAGTFLRHVTGGVMDWATVASLGAAFGTGTNGKLTKWTGTNNVGDSIVSETPGNIAVAGILAATTVNASVDVNAVSNVVGAIVKGTSQIHFGTSPIIKATTSVAAPSLKVLNLEEQVADGHSTILNIRGSSGALWINGNQVLGAQISGWGDPTGTKSRLTFNADTVSTSSLAFRVAALIDDLKQHGMIRS